MNYSKLSQLGSVSVEEFLQRYWQKQPLLIRQAFPDFVNPLPAEELAGFSLEEDVISRLVIEDTQQQAQWRTLHGPFSETDFSSLPKSHWTLLVQQVNTLHEELDALLQAFRFIPRWRLEDIMVSYAADQGSVGPHFDYYDVFLLQAEGERRWQLGQHCDSASPLVPGLDTKILAEFDCQQAYLLQPGDMLYIPPGVAHWGVAQGECITYSIGFRAPSHSEILLDYFTGMAAKLTEDQRYTDPSLSALQHSAEITPAVIERLQALLKQMNDAKSLSQWFGEYMTQPLNAAPEPLSDNEQVKQISHSLHHTKQALHPDLRCAFYGLDNTNALLFVEGQSWPCSIELAKTLTGDGEICFSALSDSDKNVVVELSTLGLLTTF